LCALGLCILILAEGALHGGVTLLLESLRDRSLIDQVQVWVGFLTAVLAIPVAFLAIGFAIVGVRKWLSRRKT
jgi:Na+-translocating ferredoxin:NAD+ oxidoreductase RnfE subunit